MKAGFSFIELLFVLTILCVIASMSYPSYKEYLMRARRSDGQLALFDLAQRMESYYLKHKTYRGAEAIIQQHAWYTISIQHADAHSYLLYAIPQKSQAQDTLCQTLTLNQSGILGITKGPYGIPHGNNVLCW